MKGQFISGGDFLTGSNAEKTLAQLHSEQPAWGPEDILYGLENLHRVSDSKVQLVWPLPHASLVYLPAAKKQHTAFAVLAAGGAYGAVWAVELQAEGDAEAVAQGLWRGLHNGRGHAGRSPVKRARL